MSGGVTSRIGYRYQDKCALYFLMHEYMAGADFEIFYSELGEIDFETQHSDRLCSYQAKTNGKLTASDLNDLIKKHQSRITGFSKKSGKLVFLSEASLQNSLQHMVLGSAGNKTVERYRTTAFTDIDQKSLALESKIFSKSEISRLIYGITNEFLKNIKGDDTYPSDVVDQFSRVLLDQIAEISCEAVENNRSLDKVKIEKIVARFIKNITWRSGTKRERFPSISASGNTIKEIASAKIPEETSPLRAEFYE